jgi:hypothetical protein
VGGCLWCLVRGKMGAVGGSLSVVYCFL